MSPSDHSATLWSRPTPAVFFALLALALLHVLVGAPLGLSVDEAHYALYAAHLDWSYFDHPPLVGWIQWPLVALNAPVLLLRLVPGALWLLCAWIVVQLADRLVRLMPYAAAARVPGQPGLWALGVMALSPLLHVLGIGLVPDTLLMALTALAVWLTLDLLQAQALQRWHPWLAMGLVLGLAGLSKYTALLTAAALAWSLLRAHGLALLRAPGPWAMVAVALVCVLPVLGWNATQDWASFSYQARHGAGGDWNLMPVFRFLLLQLVAFGPLLLWGWRPARAVGRPYTALLAFATLPLAVLALASGGGTSLPHWGAPAWVALAPWAGIGLAQQWARQRLFVLLWALAQALLCVGLMTLMLTAGQPFWRSSVGLGNAEMPSNPFADLHGWEQAGARAIALATQHGQLSVSVQNWTLASRIAWYARPLPVYVLQDRFDQFDLWAGDLPRGASTLLVEWSQLAHELPLGVPGFAHCTALETLPVVRFGYKVAEFAFYHCHEWSGQPQPRLKGH